MKRFWSLLLSLSLVVSAASPAYGDPFSDYMNSALMKPNTPNQTIKDLTRRLDYQAIAGNDDLMTSFIDALVSGDNPTMVQNLATQFEKNEATYIRLIETLVDKARTNPEVMQMASRNAARLEEVAKQIELPDIHVGGRIYSMAIFSLTYLSLVYSLRGVAPETYHFASDMITSNNALSILMLIATMRQSINFGKGLKAFFRKLKERQHATAFLKNFKKWIDGADQAASVKELSVLMKIHRYAILSPVRFKRSRDLMTHFQAELVKLDQLGLLSKFQTFLNRRTFKDRIGKMMAVMSPQEWRQFREAHPDDHRVIKVKNRPTAMIYYNSAHLEVVRWLAASEQNTTAGLRTALQERLDVAGKKAVSHTNPSAVEMISTHILTLGGLAIGGGLALASGSIPQLDPLFPADLLAYVRDPVIHGNLDVATLFLPGFALLLHEFDWLIARTKNFGSRRRGRDKVMSNLESTLDLLTVVEQELPTYVERKKYIQDLDILVNTSDSAIDVIENIEKGKLKTYSMLCQRRLIKIEDEN